MKVGILTFHASHNYGSMLQAYALQQTVIGLGHECEIINFRTERQRRFYRPFYTKGGLRSKVKALLYPRIAFNDYRKYQFFEHFLHDKLRLSEQQYSTFEQLRDADLPYDTIIAGSDQIWNTSCFDHDPAYFLSFVPADIRKVAYAPSMGPEPQTQVRREFEKSIRKALAGFSAISVRESDTADRVEQITGHRPTVTIDPTLLLTPEQWQSLIPSRQIYKKDYILAYTPTQNEKVFSEGIGLSKKLNLDIVVTQSHKSRYWKSISNRFRFINATGPLEFLNLLKNSSLIVTDSFHAVVFSILFNKKFLSVDSGSDSRICHLFQAISGTHQDPTGRALTESLSMLRQQSTIYLKSSIAL